MKYFISILLFTMVLSSSSTKAKNYTREWRQVNNYIESDLPQKALDVVQQIFNMADSTNNETQLLKCAFTMGSMEDPFFEENFRKSIERLSGILPKLTDERINICHALIGNCYREYYDRNYWSISDNPITDDTSIDYALWDNQKFLDTIFYHLYQSVSENQEQCIKATKNSYKEYINIGDKTGISLRPTLLDILLDNALWDEPRFDATPSELVLYYKPGLFGTMSDFLKTVDGLPLSSPAHWNIKILKMMSERNKTSSINIRASIDERRMEVFESMTELDPKLLYQGYLALSDEYLETSPTAAHFLYKAAQYQKDNNCPSKAVELCNKALSNMAIRKYPKNIRDLANIYDIECSILKGGLLEDEIIINTWGDLAVDTTNICSITYRNVSDINFRVVSTKDEISKYGVDMVDTLLSIASFKSWKESFKYYDDYLTHSSFFSLPSLPAGNYYLLASPDSTFSKKSKIAYIYLEITDIVFIKKVFTSSSMTGYVADCMNGLPIDGCKYTLYKIENRDSSKKMQMKGVTEEDGLIHFEGLPNGEYEIELQKGMSQKSEHLYLPYRSDIPLPLITRLYSDRYSYRAGDSIQFCGVIYSSNGYTIGKMRSDIPLRVMLLDTNWQKVDSLSLTSNEYGSVSGSLNIPENALPGRYTIRIEGQDEYVYYNNTINVEAYNQPTFNIEFLQDEHFHNPDTPINISGTVLTLTGVPVNGAQVIYYVDYQKPAFGFRPHDTQNTNIVSGETVTDAKGIFTIPYKVISGIHLAPNETELVTSIRVSVTDLNGETRDGSTMITIGKRDRMIVAPISDSYFSNVSMKISLRNLSGDLVAGKASISISKLKCPCNNHIDISSVANNSDITASDSIRDLFPLLDFDNNSDKSKWVEEKHIMNQDITFRSENWNTFELPKMENGSYRITITSEGADTIIKEFVVTNTESNIMPDNSQLLVIAEKSTYLVGDTARIHIGSNLNGATIFYILENRFGDENHGILKIDNEMRTLEVPITEDLLGGFSISYCTIHDRVAANQSLSFEVPFIEKKLNLSLSTFRDIIEPDTKENWTIKVTDYQGNPVSAALILSMYDYALDCYGTNDWMFSPWSGVFFDNSLLYVQDSNESSLYGLSNTIWRGGNGIVFSEFKSMSQYYLRDRSMNYLEAGSVSTKSTFNSAMMTSDDIMANAMVDSDSELNVSDKEESSTTFDKNKIILRTNQNPTAFFISNVNTETDGTYKLNFTSPQLLTQWNLKGLAYTKDLEHGELMANIITRKELMLEPAAPRFLRQGDTIDFTSKVSNLTESEVSATVHLEIADAISGKSIRIIDGPQTIKIVIPSNGSAKVSFRLNIPTDINALTYTITAFTSAHSDGQKQTLPVLSNHTRVVQSISLFNNGNETRHFSFDKMKDVSHSSTISDQSVTLEYSSSPIWYAIQALPYLEEDADPTNERLYHRFMANNLSSYIVSHNPEISKILSSWSKGSTDAWQTQLEKNQDLKQTLLEETPWVLESNNEKENLRRLAKAFNRQSMKLENYALMNQLLAAQESDGGWAWIKGYESNIHTTTMIVNGIGLLYESFTLNLGKEKKLKMAIMNAINYLDSYFLEEYNKRDKEYEDKVISYSVLNYLLARSYYKTCQLLNGTQESFDYYMAKAQKVDTHNVDLYYRTALALLMARTDHKETAETIIKTIMDRSLYDDELGRYWKDNVGGYLWQQAPIETQSLIIGALAAVGGYEKEITECQRWLLKQKQTTHWATAPASAKAVLALLLDGKQLLLDTPPTEITIGDETLTSVPNNTNGGYFSKRWQESDVPDVSDITVSTTSTSIGWGAIYHQYLEEMDKVEGQGNGISIDRSLYKVVRDGDGDKLLQTDGNHLDLLVGDRVRVRLLISTDRNLEFVQVKDMRAASMEPVSTKAGIRYNFTDDIRYYIAPGDNSTMIYIDRISKGKYVIEYDLYVQKSGTFNMGISTIQCMYAPTFRANSDATRITVK